MCSVELHHAKRRSSMSDATETEERVQVKQLMTIILLVAPLAAGTAAALAGSAAIGVR
jgi:hypothetical protein